MKTPTVRNDNNRIPYLSWLILPILTLWVLTSYLIGFITQPKWNENSNFQVEAANDPVLKSVTFSPPEYHWNGQALISLWFDDAWLSQYTQAQPILEEKGFKAALAVYVGGIDGESYMNWAQVKRLHYKGWEITAHSRTHNCEINKLSDANLVLEQEGSKQDLLAKGLPADIFVPPCGVYNPRMIEISKKYFIGSRTSDGGLNPIPVTDPYNLKIREVSSQITVDDVNGWIKQAQEEKMWLILMFHKIDHSNEHFSTTPEKFSQIIKNVQASTLSVVLPSQVLTISK